MKIFIASDIHGSFTALEKLISAFNSEKAELLVLCGDYLNHGPRNNIPFGYDTKKTSSLLNEYKNKIVGVRGNCDSEVDQMILQFPVTSDSTQIYIPQKKSSTDAKPNGRIFITHGHLYTDENLKSFLPEGTLIISGHTHVPVLTFKDGFYFLNPGSISIPKTDDGATYAVLEYDSIEGFCEISIYSLSGEKLKTLSFTK